MPRKPKKPTAPDLGYISPDLRPLAVDVALLDEDEENARHHGERDLAAITRSLELFGQAKPVVVVEKPDGRFRVIAGNGTTRAARELGWSHLALARYPDEKSARAYAIADNRTAELSRWDGVALTRSLAEIAKSGVALDEDLGFGAADLKRSGVDVDRLLEEAGDALGDLAMRLRPSTDVEARTDVEKLAKPGDLWLLGRHRVVCGDATDPAACEKAVGDLAPWIMVTDPPYGVNYDPAWRESENGGPSSPMSVHRVGTVMNDGRASWAEAYALFRGDVAYVWHAGIHAPTVFADLASCRLEVRTQVIWRKPRAPVSRGAYHWQHEPCWYAVRKGKGARWCGDRTQSTIWDIDNHVEQKTNHGTQKPVECMARPIRNHGEPGDVVFDPFLGSGTTIIAAHQLDRTCVGLELSPEYVDVIIDRFKRFAPGEKVEVVR